VALLLTACRSAAVRLPQENEAGAQLSIFLLAGHRGMGSECERDGGCRNKENNQCDGKLNIYLGLITNMTYPCFISYA